MISDDSFLDRATRELLALFAAGRNTPGAGSAAALAGAIAAGLLETVVRHTIKAAACAQFHDRAETLLERVRERSRRLRAAVDEDAAAFERFWRERTPETLQQATEIPLAIAEDCLVLVEIGIELYDHGFKNARGESAAAALSALANGEAAAQCARINLQFAGGARWAEGTTKNVIDLRRRLRELRAAVEARIYDEEERR
ncbi:MAG TPA: cyclodeaminase/cyclohydrolase family protein [Thermoanaerobaculia bacterium]|jgi:formiminotetrahydrofolate cyclodeaminase|nr:cyclodeaminase/cyclohydrolase family protein [Thermoanaerobaculia bacterium]